MKPPWFPSGAGVITAIGILFFSVTIGLVIAAIVALFYHEWFLAAVLFGGAVFMLEPWKIWKK